MNISQHIWKLLEKDLSIQRNITRKLINIRALAKYLIKKYSLKFTLDSVISSIRRYESDRNWITDEKKIKNLFKNAQINTKSNMVCFTFKKPIGKYIQEIYKKMGLKAPDMKAITGSVDTKIIVEEGEANLILKNIPKEKLAEVKKDLCEISITISQEAIQTKGVLARIANEIAINNINIGEMIICPPEFLIYVQKKDMITTHETLLRLNGLP